MSLHAFQLLSSVAQLYWVLRNGTFLANRLGPQGGVNLYHCAGRGFFAEVAIDEVRTRPCPLARRRIATSTVSLS